MFYGAGSSAAKQFREEVARALLPSAPASFSPAGLREKEGGKMFLKMCLAFQVAKLKAFSTTLSTELADLSALKGR